MADTQQQPQPQKKEEPQKPEPIIEFPDFHSPTFWNIFYKGKTQDNINFYFDLTKIRLDNFSFSTIGTEDTILILGPGTSSTINFLDEKNYQYVDMVDFSEEVVQILSAKYSTKPDWTIAVDNIIAPEKFLKTEFNFYNME